MRLSPPYFCPIPYRRICMSSWCVTFSCVQAVPGSVSVCVGGGDGRVGRSTSGGSGSGGRTAGSGGHDPHPAAAATAAAAEKQQTAAGLTGHALLDGGDNGILQPLEEGACKRARGRGGRSLRVKPRGVPRPARHRGQQGSRARHSPHAPPTAAALPKPTHRSWFESSPPRSRRPRPPPCCASSAASRGEGVRRRPHAAAYGSCLLAGRQAQHRRQAQPCTSARTSQAGRQAGKQALLAAPDSQRAWPAPRCGRTRPQS